MDLPSSSAYSDPSIAVSQIQMELASQRIERLQRKAQDQEKNVDPENDEPESEAEVRLGAYDM